jgi:hypothetical protein
VAQLPINLWASVLLLMTRPLVEERCRAPSAAERPWPRKTSLAEDAGLLLAARQCSSSLSLATSPAVATTSVVDRVGATPARPRLHQRRLSRATMPPPSGAVPVQPRLYRRRHSLFCTSLTGGGGGGGEEWGVPVLMGRRRGVGSAGTQVGFGFPIYMTMVKRING